jgi:hypothetical protein
VADDAFHRGLANSTGVAPRGALNSVSFSRNGCHVVFSVAVFFSLYRSRGAVCCCSLRAVLIESATYGETSCLTLCNLHRLRLRLTAAYRRARLALQGRTTKSQRSTERCTSPWPASDHFPRCRHRWHKSAPIARVPCPRYCRCRIWMLPWILPCQPRPTISPWTSLSIWALNSPMARECWMGSRVTYATDASRPSWVRGASAAHGKLRVPLFVDLLFAPWCLRARYDMSVVFFSQWLWKNKLSQCVIRQGRLWHFDREH